MPQVIPELGSDNYPTRQMRKKMGVRRRRYNLSYQLIYLFIIDISRHLHPLEQLTTPK